MRPPSFAEANMFERTVTFFRQMVSRPDPWEQPGGSATEQDERRAWPRYSADLEAVCRPAGASPRDEFKARVRNVSLGGISLLVPRAFVEGDLINIQLPGPAPESRCTVLACV